ncbi:MAG: hypothetical protein KDC57_20720 [Saprospiraceae bacterium]|nr:hypothetical protein [Saprospiraceae bacterium]
MNQLRSLQLVDQLRKGFGNPVMALQGYQASQQVLSLALSILLARVLRDTSQIGFYEMLVFLAFLLTYFWLTGISQSFMRSTSASDVDRYGKWFFTYALMVGVNILVFALLLVSKHWTLPVLLGQEQVPYLGSYTIYLLLTIPTYALPLIWVLEGKARSIWWFALVGWLAKFLAMALPLLLGYGLLAAIRCLIAVGVLLHLIVVVNIIQRRRFIHQWRWFRMIGRGSLPLIIYAMIGAMALAVDSILIGRTYSDERIFALFRYGSKELPFVGALVGALIHSVLPLFYEENKLGAAALLGGSKKLIHILFPLSIFLVWINPWLFPHLFTPAFRDSAFLFNIYLLTLTPRLWLVHALLISRHQHRAMIGISVCELMINVIVSLIAMQWMGMYGVAVGTVVAFLFEKFVMSWMMQRQGIPIHTYVPLRAFSLYSLALYGSVIFVWWNWYG